jgi:U4/U6.U5 tri-snRNP-associated protein 1
MKNSDTPLLSVERMREAQARMKIPYLVLSGDVKPDNFLGKLNKF